METNTIHQATSVLSQCISLFEKKTKDYGTAWRILRLPSLTDQIYIKALRIRTIQEKGKQMVSDNVEDEFLGIINYSIIALCQEQLILKAEQKMELDLAEAVALYKQQSDLVLSLLKAKNHDYGEAWRNMRVSSITDIILMKLLRIKQIEDNQGKTLVSEGVSAGYMDMINYSIFALVLLNEGRNS